MGILKRIFNNTGRPQGFLGTLMVSGMNTGHAEVSDWGIDCLEITAPGNIIELGCGGGRNAARLMEKYRNAKLCALDYSEVSVRKTIQTNWEAVSSGRCTVIQGNVAQLPFVFEQFDLATAFETVYFWPGPVESFCEVYKVLKPGGSFLIVNESDGTNPADKKWKNMIDNMRIYTARQLCEHLYAAGFTEIWVHCNEKKHWICVLARK